MTNRTDLAGRIFAARQHRGWTQHALASHLGVYDVVVSRWERGVASPSGEHVQNLLALFGPDLFTKGESNDNEET